MRKVTKYEVSGVLDTKPTNLPDGLKVTEIESTDMMENLILPGFSTSERARFFESHSVEKGFGIEGIGTFPEEQTRKLRDWLNAILGEEFTMRVVVDDVNDVWFELSPGLFWQGNDEGDTNPNPYQRAIERKNQDKPDGLCAKTLEHIDGAYGPLRVIENRWGD